MKYTIRVTKHSISSQTFEVDADSPEEIEDRAFEEAFSGDGEWEDEETLSHTIEILGNEKDEETDAA